MAFDYPLKVSTVSSDIARAGAMVIKKMYKHVRRLRNRSGKQRNRDLNVLAEPLLKFYKSKPSWVILSMSSIYQCVPHFCIFLQCFHPFPRVPSQSLLRPAENLLPDQNPDEPDEPEPSDDAMEDDDNEGGESQESEESDGEIVGTDIDSGSDAQSHTGQDVQGCLEPSAVVVSEESPLGSQSGTPLAAVEQVVLQHPDGSSEVYELDANRDSNIPPEKLPLVGTKIGEHPAPSVSVPGLI